MMPIAALRMRNAISGDPYFANVSSLLHFDGANASTTFTDEKGKVWTPSGNAQLSTAWSAFGTASGSFDGAGDYISTPANVDFAFGSGQFTIEGIVRFNTAPSNTVLASQWGSLNPLTAWALFMDSGILIFRFYDGINFYDVSSAWSPASNTEYRMAVDRDAGSVIRIYVDGVVKSSGTFAQSVNVSTNPITIGIVGGFVGAYDLNGRVDEFRITKGVARYAGAYVVATSSFPNS